MKESQTFLSRIKNWNHFKCKGKVSSWIPSFFEDNRRLSSKKENEWYPRRKDFSVYIRIRYQ